MFTIMLLLRVNFLTVFEIYGGNDGCDSSRTQQIFVWAKHSQLKTGLEYNLKLNKVKKVKGNTIVC